MPISDNANQRQRRAARHRAGGTTRGAASVHSVDIHAHFYTHGYLDTLEKHGYRVNCSVTRTDEGVIIVMPSGARQNPLTEIYTDIEPRLALMDEKKVTMQALSLTSPMCHFSDDVLNRDLAQGYNDGASDFHRQHPDRFVGLIALPMLNAADSVAELDRAAKLPGMRGVYMGTNIDGHNLSDERFAPIWAKVAALDLPVFLHPVMGIMRDRLHSYHTINTLGNPFDSTIAATFIIMSGLLDRHPNLTINLPHAGGVLPYVISRVDHGWRVRPECKHLQNAPSSYLRRFSYDTISHGDAQLKFLASLVGVDRIMMGSDYCFDMGYEQPVDHVLRQDWLSDADKALVVGGNARRVLGIPEPA
jgi:aminocarboxymuconate-semialdehyde decarboxylase